MKRLKKMRELSGLTQMQLAMLTGVDRATLCLAENRQLKLSRAQQKNVRTVLTRIIRVRAKELQEAVLSFDRELTEAR